MRTVDFYPDNFQTAKQYLAASSRYNGLPNFVAFVVTNSLRLRNAKIEEQKASNSLTLEELRAAGD